MPKKKVKTLLKTLKKRETKLVNFRATEKEIQDIQSHANEFANGNISEWIRYSSLNFIPHDEDLL